MLIFLVYGALQNIGVKNRNKNNEHEITSELMVNVTQISKIYHFKSQKTTRKDTV